MAGFQPRHGKRNTRLVRTKRLFPRSACVQSTTHASILVILFLGDMLELFPVRINVVPRREDALGHQLN